MPQVKEPTEAAASELNRAARAIRKAAAGILQELVGAGSPVEMMTTKYDWLQPIVRDILIRQLFDKDYHGYRVKDGPLRKEINDSAARLAHIIMQAHLTPEREARLIQEALSKKMTTAAVKRAMGIAIEESIEDRAKEIMKQRIQSGMLDPAIQAVIEATLHNGGVPTRQELIELILSTAGTEGENE